MKTLPHPRTGEGAAVLGVLTLVVLELVALIAAPAWDRPVVAGALVGAAASVLIVIAALWRHHRRTAAHRVRVTAPVGRDEEWFTAQSLEGFPTEAVRPLLLGPDAPALDRLYVAWLLATHGHDAVWIERHLDLPGEVVHLLVDAARQRH